MAKTDKWRSTYALARAMRAPFFNGPVAFWTKNQIEFGQWCEFYYNVMQDTERPSNKILQDDLALDNWLNTRRLKMRQEMIKNNAANANANGGGSPNEHEEFTF